MVEALALVLNALPTPGRVVLGTRVGLAAPPSGTQVCRCLPLVRGAAGSRPGTGVTGLVIMASPVLLPHRGQELVLLLLRVVPGAEAALAWRGQPGVGWEGGIGPEGVLGGLHQTPA